jgi:Rrf2 family iron-sulfur cluster assembly transcriptional regulator
LDPVVTATHSEGNIMRMSTKGRFAVNALIDLALREHAGPVALASIGQRQQVSLSYLEQLFSRLRRDGIVHSTRGPGGGYTLARDAAQISVAQIVSAVADPAEELPAEERSMGLTRELWQRLDAALLERMATITLASLVDEQVHKGVRVETRPVRRPMRLAPVPKPVRTLPPNSVFAFGRSFAA